MAKAKFYTYVHRRGDTGEVFYVGKGSGNRSGQACSRGSWWKKVAGRHGFTVEIVAYWYAEQDALDHERDLITEYRAGGVQLVNATDGGEGICGYRHTPETRAIIAAAGRGHSRKHSPETRARLSEIGRGRKATPEARANMSASRMGRTLSDEHKEKLSQAFKGRPRAPLSEQQRRKISEALRGRKRSPFSDEHKAKIAEAGRGKVMPDEVRQKISASNKGKVIPPDQRQKLSEATRKYWERVRAQRNDPEQLEINL